MMVVGYNLEIKYYNLLCSTNIESHENIMSTLLYFYICHQFCHHFFLQTLDYNYVYYSFKTAILLCRNK